MLQTPPDMHSALTELAAEINRLRPDWRNSEEFYELRSAITGRLRMLADSPLSVRTVIRPIKIEVPPSSPPQETQEAGLPVMLNADELGPLFSHTYARRGGFQDRYRHWQQRIDAKTGRLLLNANDVAWIWRQASRPWKGGIQSRTRKIFWRPLGELFASLGLSPSLDPILSTCTGRRKGRTRGVPQRLRAAAAQREPAT